MGQVRIVIGADSLALARMHLDRTIRPLDDCAGHLAVFAAEQSLHP